MNKIEALKELENQAETLATIVGKTLEEIRAMIVAEESPPKPNLVGASLREVQSANAELQEQNDMMLEALKCIRMNLIANQSAARTAVWRSHYRRESYPRGWGSAGG